MSFKDKTPGQVQPAPENFDPGASQTVRQQTRRGFLRSGLLTAGAAVSLPMPAQAADPDIVNLPPWSTRPGHHVARRAYGLPSHYQVDLIRRELPGYTSLGANSGSFCPLQGLFGIITPSGLHFERHHHGWHDIDPDRHRLMLNSSDPALMDRARIYTLADLIRLPPVSRIHFVECGGNTGFERKAATAPTVQYSHGLISCSEFTGVPLRLLLEECGVDFRRARYVLAEGADGASLTRTIPMELVESGEVLVAYAQNGEHLRPENGFPLRLVVPGVQGVSWVKWLRRIEVGTKPWATREEALRYVDPMPDGSYRQYASLQQVKSVITTPSGGQKLLTHGFYNITGLAWSGRGRVQRVDVSVNGGHTWQPARLETPVLSKALTRFNFNWTWDGSETALQSRAVDDAGDVQPTWTQLRAENGTASVYHNNAIQSWHVQRSGNVANVQIS